MISAIFENLLDAAIYRRNHGGWLFVGTYGFVQWFDAAHYTASHIMFVVKRDGDLVCDNRYLPKGA